MSTEPQRLQILPCLDSAEMADQRQRELDIPRGAAVALGESAVRASSDGYYFNAAGSQVDWSHAIAAACAGKRSIHPEDELPHRQFPSYDTLRIQVTNETTLAAARRLIDAGLRPLALNFANGIYPGGGFLSGARAQEEALCRSSALYQTLVGDPMYDAHRLRAQSDSTDWAIYSPNVPVFRSDDGKELDQPWQLSFLTCAAPYAPAIGQPHAGNLLQQRIHRVLQISRSCGYSALVLGAWGCGAFKNDTHRTARDFRDALLSEVGRAFSDVVFAVTDWSPERRYLGPFREVFQETIS